MVLRYPLILFLLTVFIMSCQTDSPQKEGGLQSGVTRQLARQRASLLSDVQYDFTFSIPESSTQSIPASVTMTFALRNADTSLALDFRQPVEHVLAVNINGEEVDIQLVAEHIILPAQRLTPGDNRVVVDFIAGDMSLNRSDDYLYTLLVPDRASTVFPCFDQPDLKAQYRLKLDIPATWEASANGALDSLWVAADRKHLQFAPTRPFSTYVFGFAAGAFQKRTARRKGRTMTMLFRETDTAKVDNNADAIFDLHAQSIDWMERYTSIAFPFGKFDFVLIPGFQYGGMEHIGNIFYRESSLMLEADAPRTQQLSRARLIAHETAHMWFGNLVTMEWFNDVWLKEVFANFMAAKMVNPSFPDINHDLNFVWSHLPSAFSEDRSEGSHPIRQELDNLKNAGTLYGRIIYQKAPVVMRQLEARLGEEAFRDGLREYLQRYAYSNATWDDLITILDRGTTEDLSRWSTAWVKRPGMPTYHLTYNTSAAQIDALTIVADNTTEDDLHWDQETRVAIIYGPDSYQIRPHTIAGKRSRLTLPEPAPAPRVILPNASPMSYGYFTLNAAGRDYLLQEGRLLADPLLRATAYWSLYEEGVRNNLSPVDLATSFLAAAKNEPDPLNQQRLLGYLQDMFWQYLRADEREQFQQQLSDDLWAMLSSGDHRDNQATIWSTYQSTALPADHRERLYRLWAGEEDLPALTLTENRRISLAATLAIVQPERAEEVLSATYDSIANPDQKARFAFLMPALSPDAEERKRFFTSLKKPENREKEPWVGTGLRYLHHPLRTETSIRYVRPALEMMPEIQATGDIFFPRQWASATLSGHQSKEAARIVRDFMRDNPDLSYRLRNKIWMAADPLLRSSAR